MDGWEKGYIFITCHSLHAIIYLYSFFLSVMVGNTKKKSKIDDIFTF